MLPAVLGAIVGGAIGGAIFMALFFAAFQGVLINVMTPSAFRRVSPWIQMVAMTVLVTVFLLTPGVSAKHPRPRRKQHSRAGLHSTVLVPRHL